MTEASTPQSGPGDQAARLSLLSEAQLDVLALVAEHRSSKEIARVLGISQHTVDQRMKRVQALMGVASRFDAARIWSANANIKQTTAPLVWGDLMYQPSALVEEHPFGDNGMSGRQGHPDTRTSALNQTQLAYDSRAERLPWFANLLKSGSANDLSSLARTVVIAVLTLAAVLSLAAVVSLAEGLSRLV